MYDMRNVPEDEIGASQGKVHKAIDTFKRWIKPVDIGRYGLSLNVGSKEIFIGVCLTRIETEVIVRRKNKRIKVKTTGVRIIDL